MNLNPTTFTLSDCEAESLARVTDDRFYAVCLKPEGTLIGHLYAAQQNEKFATWILATSSTAAITDADMPRKPPRTAGLSVFTPPSPPRHGKCDPKNAPSWKLLERLGMRREAHHKMKFFSNRIALGSRLEGYFVYAMLREEWEQTLNKS